MMWALSVIGGCFALVVLGLVWGAVRIRRGSRQALEAARHLNVADIEPLVRECVEVFETRLGVRLDLENCDEAAARLDAAFQDRHRLKTAFARDDSFWYFARPVGACLGELLRRHACHEWRKRPDEAPFLVVAMPGGESKVYPFEKVVRQALFGTPGDLVAYVASARAFGSAVQSGRTDAH